MGIFSWIIIGGLSGWIASKIAGKSRSLGLVGNVVIGIIGALIGAFILNLLTGNPVDLTFSFQSLLVSIFGSVVLLTVINLFKSN
ncbi:MAG: GlsB/YeaQ/YmgE family stress response membrane protein [Firmicutes bacterium]|nr:GlsB/YeaQ/YmgE family stress response membrane protein [Bacillota bacterium]